MSRSSIILLFALLFVGSASATKSPQFDFEWEVNRSSWIAVGNVLSAEATKCIGEVGYRAYKISFKVEQRIKGEPNEIQEVLVYLDGGTDHPKSGERFLLLFEKDRSKCGEVIRGPGFLKVTGQNVDTRKVSLDRELMDISEVTMLINKFLNKDAKRPATSN